MKRFQLGRCADAFELHAALTWRHFAGLDGFWAPLAAGTSLAAPVPLQRWDVEAYYSPEVRSPASITLH